MVGGLAVVLVALLAALGLVVTSRGGVDDGLSTAQRDTRVSEAERTEATSTGEVVALGVGDLDDDSATVLVAANSTVTNSGTGAEGQVRYYRLRLDLVREDGRWLTSAVEFVR